MKDLRIGWPILNAGVKWYPVEGRNGSMVKFIFEYFQCEDEAQAWIDANKEEE